MVVMIKIMNGGSLCLIATKETEKTVHTQSESCREELFGGHQLISLPNYTNQLSYGI